jgi:hypothetical protein
LQWVLNLGRLQEHTQQRRGGEICDTESLADKIRAVLPLVLDAVERRGNDSDPAPICSR